MYVYIYICIYVYVYRTISMDFPAGPMYAACGSDRRPLMVPRRGRAVEKWIRDSQWRGCFSRTPGWFKHKIMGFNHE